MSAGLLDLKINMVAVAALTYQVLHLVPRGLKDFDIHCRILVTA